jgi:hypothetical protein
MRPAQGHQLVQRRLGAGLGRVLRQAGESGDFQAGAKVEDLIANCNPDCRSTIPATPEHAKWKILNWEIGVAPRRSDPGDERWIVSLVHAR